MARAAKCAPAGEISAGELTLYVPSGGVEVTSVSGVSVDRHTLPFCCREHQHGKGFPIAWAARQRPRPLACAIPSCVEAGSEPACSPSWRSSGERRRQR